MKKVIFLLCLLVLPNLLFAQTFSQYEVNKTALQPKIDYYADFYHVSAKVMNYIIDHESSYDATEVGDTELTCRRTGKIMHAIGLAQINDCFWPNITTTQALDPDFAINFLAYWIGQGHCRFWTTCPIDRYLALK